MTCESEFELPGVQCDRGELMKPAWRDPQNMVGITTCTDHEFVRTNIVEELDVRDEAGLMDELAAKQLVEDPFQRPKGALILNTDVSRK